MPKRGSLRNTLSAMLPLLTPAWLLFALAALVEHPLALIPILAANMLVMVAICRGAGFDLEASALRTVALRGTPYFVMSTANTAVVAAMLFGPVWWLAHDGSLPAALALSAALAASLFMLWRVWPAFALPFVWDDAYPDTAHASWLSAVLRRSFAFARHLTREHELLLAFGLPAGIALLLLALGALCLGGFGGALVGDTRIAVLALYAVLLSPLAHAVLVNRCLRALLADARSRRARPAEDAPAGVVEEDAPQLPAGISQSELDRTLLCAVHSTQVDLALAALERGGDPNATPPNDQRDQRSALMVAVTLPDLRLLRALIARGVDINRAVGGITPLIAATRDSYEGRPEAVTTLLANGADPRTADAQGNTPLHLAARGADPVIAALLVDAGAQIDAVNADGFTPLAIACGSANWRIAEFLLEHGAQTQAQTPQPAIVHAAAIAEDDPAGVKLLLRRRAAIDARAPLERTALMAAALAGNARIVEALLAGGATVDLADHRGTTALMEAARSGVVAAIDALGKRKPQPNHVDGSGRTALMIACQSRQSNEDAVRALLTLGADRGCVGSDGKRALDHAAAAGRWHIVALLDPEYPLPSTLGSDGAPRQEAHADHLLDALRFGHWNVAAEFVGVLDQWPAAALADLYLDLSDDGHAAARDWLANHGLDPAAQVSIGDTLVEALVAQLPASTDALRELLARGAPTGGAGLVARVLAKASGEAGDAALRDLARELLARGADWCGGVEGRRSTLHLAVAQGQVALTRDLLDRGADPDARDAQGRTPLHLAVVHEGGTALPLLQALVAAGADPEIATAVGETPLGLALAADPARARWLNWTGWRLPQRRLQQADLVAAAAAGDLDAVARLIELGLPLDATDAQGATALIRAAGSGHAALVVQLLDAGADTRCVSRSGMHCLAAAVAARREAVVRTLLSHGVAVDLPISGGGTALILAAALGEPRTVEALLESGANANAADDAGVTPLQALAQHAFGGGDAADARAVFDRLLQAGARLDTCNSDGQDALLVLLGARAQPGAHCDAEGVRALSEYLLQIGASVDTQDRRGVGVLHACALHGLLGCARLLKAHGAAVDQIDAFGRSAADVAALLGYVDVAAELGMPHASRIPGVRQTLRRPARAPD